jgi:osmotically-inducible protein OsmY
MSDEDLVLDVSEELVWDPKLATAGIAVDADDGVVTLRGTVGTLRQKIEAKRAAERVHGVRKVQNELEVRLITDDRKEDVQFRADVLQALMLDSDVPATVDARVDDGVVTLTGTAEYQFQREEAERVASKIVGVLNVSNQITIAYPTPDAEEVKESIERAFTRNADIDADDVRVSTSDGSVILEGSVRSWSEHDAALAAAWSAPGVKHVDDRLHVVY